MNREKAIIELEAKIISLENKKAEMEESACYVLADILEGRIEELKIQLEG